MIKNSFSIEKKLEYRKTQNTEKLNSDEKKTR